MKTFSDLPKFIQRLIILHLERNNFPAAKQIYDYWIQSETAGGSRMQRDDIDKLSTKN